MTADLDLKKLLRRIDDEKNLQADLCLDLDCIVTAPDTRPLIRVINYVINYCRRCGDGRLHIGLSAQKDLFVASFLMATRKESLPLLRDDIAEVLSPYHARMETLLRAGEFVKILLRFPRDSFSQSDVLLIKT